MPMLHVIMEGDGAWPDLTEKLEQWKLQWFRDVPGEPQAELSVAALPEGMSTGRTSIAIRVDLPDGEVIVVESSLRIWAGAIASFRARYGD